MTKCEPFARVERWEDTDFVVTFPGWTSVREFYTRSEAVELAHKMNAAHQVIVKEEVKRAVEEFRNRADREIRKKVPGAHTYASENADVYRAYDAGRDAALQIIKSLPPEPEGNQ